MENCNSIKLQYQEIITYFQINEYVLNQKIKVLLFSLLLVSTAILPSSNFAYAAGDLTVTNETIEIDTEVQYDSVRINPNGILIINPTGKLIAGSPGNPNAASIVILPGGQLIVENLDGEPKQNGEVISHGLFLLGTVIIDGIFKEFTAINEKNDGVIFERCGALELQTGALSNSVPMKHPDGCAANTTEKNDWVLDNDPLVDVEYTVEKNHVLILTGELIIEGILENFAIIKNITPGLISNGGEIRNFGADAKLIHVCGEFEDGTNGLIRFSGEGSWPTEENEDNVEITICAKPVANDDGSEGVPFVTTTEDEIFNVDLSINVIENNDFDSDFDPLSNTYDGDIVGFLPELTASAETSTEKGGIVNMKLDGTFSYDPNGKFEKLQSGQSTTDIFTYRIDDGTGGTNTALVTIGITGENDPPVAVNDPKTGNISINEDASIIISVLNNDSDPENDPLSITSVSAGTIGTTTHDGTDVTYTPNPNLTGSDSFTYTISDGNGGISTATVNINVIEQNDPPVITILGDSTVTVTLGDVYDDAGATAFDVEDLDLTSSIITTGLPIDTGAAGTYTVDYSVTDSDGNIDSDVRTVIVETDNAPVITILGDSTVTVTLGDVYDDAGATAFDVEDLDLTSSIITTGLPIDTGAAGTYTVDYSVTDSDGNIDSDFRSVDVVDPGNFPVITILGDSTVTVTLGDVYDDAGATAFDVEDLDLTSSIITTGLPIDTGAAGTYTVDYSVTDSDGNLSTDFRTVHVQDESSNSLRDQKINEIMELESLIDKSTDKKTVDEINKALKYLNKSVETEKWEDNGNYLIDNKGKKVFNEEQKGMKHLIHILDKDKETDEFLSKISVIVLNLVDIDEQLAGLEFTAAEESGAEQKCLDKAEKEVEKVEKEEAKGKYDKAVDHLGHLWEKSVKCQ